MIVEVGKKYYVREHAYYHFLGEVSKLRPDLGPKAVEFINVIRVHSCKRGETAFFREGCMEDTRYDVYPDGHVCGGWISYDCWEHQIPEFLPGEENSMKPLAKMIKRASK